MKPEKCQYRNTCQYYEQDSICCDLVFNICYFNRQYKKIDKSMDNENIHWSLKGIEAIFSMEGMFTNEI